MGKRIRRWLSAEKELCHVHKEQKILKQKINAILSEPKDGMSEELKTAYLRMSELDEEHDQIQKEVLTAYASLTEEDFDHIFNSNGFIKK
jgi:hypothetical protein